MIPLRGSYRGSPAITQAHSASISSGFSRSPQGGIWFLPRVTEETKRSRCSGGNSRRSKALSGVLHAGAVTWRAVAREDRGADADALRREFLGDYGGAADELAVRRHAEVLDEHETTVTSRS